MIALVFLHLLQVAHLGRLQVAARAAVGRRRAVAARHAGARPHRISAAVGHGRVFRVASLAQYRRPGARRRHRSFSTSRRAAAAMGTETINRFFGLHVWLMPAALVAAGRRASWRSSVTTVRPDPSVEDPRTLRAGTLLARSVVHGRRVLVRSSSSSSASWRSSSRHISTRRPIRRSSSCRIPHGISCRSSACWRSCRRRSISGPLTISTGADRNDHRADALPASSSCCFHGSIAARRAVSAHGAACCGLRRSSSSRSSRSRSTRR